jgi:methyl-accepting chemotaxis protein
MKRFSVAARLWTPTVGMGLALALAGVGTTVRTVNLIAESRVAQQAQQARLEAAFEWRGLAEAQAGRRLAVLAGGPAVAAVLAGDLAQGETRLRELDQRVAPAEGDTAARAAVAKIRERAAAFDAAVAEAGAKAADPAALGEALKARARPALDALLQAQNEFARLQEREAETMRSAAAADRMRTVWAVLGMLALIVGALAVFSAFLVRTICRPLTAVQAVARRIGEGDLAAEIDTARPDEIGDVMRSLAGMRDALRRVVGEVRETADQIKLASGEVASGNADLSSRTEQAAGSLQQTASSMEQITGTVSQSADAARQANQLASSAAEVAQRGGSVVSEVVTTMDQITAASRRIADIIGVIDGIAFQTNILALNAAVEAARAGEQGRGFAVVAGEVRTLASRSAEAAREIKALIGGSVERVESGSRLVADAGSTMAEIVAAVQRVADIVGEISHAALEQNHGIGQVNGAVAELDRMTQQNAALVEQSAAAAESLREQAARLARTMETFRLARA